MELTGIENTRFVPAEDDRWMVTEGKIVSAVEQIVAKARPVLVRAFGSRARGDHRRGSDLDLAVILDHYDPKVDGRPMWRADISIYMEMDVLVMSRERYEFMKDSIVSVQNDIWNEGVTLYDASVGAVDRGVAARLAA